MIIDLLNLVILIIKEKFPFQKNWANIGSLVFKIELKRHPKIFVSLFELQNDYDLEKDLNTKTGPTLAIDIQIISREYVLKLC